VTDAITVTGLRRLGQRPSVWFSFLLACAGACLTPFFVPFAAATPASCSSAGFTIAPLHGTRFYVDAGTSPLIDSGYTGFSVNPAAAKTNIWVQLSGFTGGALGLNANQPSAFPLGNLGAGSTTPAYFFLTASPAAETLTAQNFTVAVWQGDPAHGGTQLCAAGDGYSAGVYSALQAAANKVQDVTGDSIAASVSTSSPVIGGTITLSVEGTTGTLGNGPDGTPFIYETPSALDTWPAGSFRLTGTTLTLNPGASQTVYTNQLQLSDASWAAAQNYIAQYTFQITGTTSTATTTYPIQEITSGTQVKHTSTGSLAAIPAIQPAANTLTVSGTGSTAALPSTGGAVTYTVKLHSTSSTSTSVDEVVDTLPVNATYQAGTAKLDGSPVADPTSSLGTLVFPGPFTLSSAADRTLTFDATLPATAGTYTNAVVGYVASTQIDTTTDTSDNMPATFATVVPAASQTITFAQPSDTRVDQSPVSLSATASSGLAVSFASNSASVCTVAGSAVTLLTVGACSITASQPGNGTYAAAPAVTRAFQVTAAPLAQTITFSQQSDTPVDQGPVSLSASASSGLAVSFASNSASVCTVAGSTVTLLTVGTCSITASQPGNATYAAASTVTRTFQVTATLQTQTITFAQPADTRVDQGPVSPSASSSSGLAVSFTSNDTSACTVSGSSVALVATGTCSITASQPGNGTFAAALPVTRTFQVTALPVVLQTQTITFAQPADARVDHSPVTVSASASSGLPVVFSSTTASVCTVSGASVTLIAVGVCSITASQAGGTTYGGAPDVTRSFQVTAAPISQTITFAQPADIQVDQGPVSVSASASSGLAITLVSNSSGVCTVSGTSVILVAAGTCSITAAQAGDGTYGAATDVTRTFQITTAPASPLAQSITFAQPADARVDQGPVSISASASSGLAVSLASSTSGVCSVSGSSVTLVAAGTCSITASQAGDGTYAAAAGVTRSFQVTAIPSPPSPGTQSIAFAQPSDTRVDQGPVSLSATASSGLAVSFSSSTPSVCTAAGSTVTLLTTGTCTIVASQSGDSTYSAASAVTRSFEVTIVTPPLAPPAPAPAPQKSPQQIEFPPIPAATSPGDSINIAASATSGMAVGYESDTPDVCTVDGTGAVTVIATGTCTIVAHQSGDHDWYAAQAAHISFGVTAPPLPAPTSSSPTTLAGQTTQSVLDGIPAGSTVQLNGATALPGVAAVRIDGTRVVVTPTAAFSGIVHVPIVVVSGNQRVETTIDITVRPKAPTEIAVTPTTSTSTRISWKGSASATGYVVRVDGRVVCRTDGTNCVVPALLAPNQHVVIASTGNLGTVSDNAPAAYAPGRPVLIAIVHFASGSSHLRRAAKAKLDSTEAKIAKGGFTKAMLTCHTDSAGSLTYNMALSHARCVAVAHYIRRQLGISRVSYRQASFAFLRPVASNKTRAGMARNRRVEVYVR
jgi:outer membrane protein OmpA-like peptidoglycan-associated protein